MNVHCTLDHGIRCCGVHDIGYTVDSFIIAQSEYRRTQDEVALSIDKHLALDELARASMADAGAAAEVGKQTLKSSISGKLMGSVKIENNIHSRLSPTL